MQATTKLCLNSNEFTQLDFVEFYDSMVEFTPTRITIGAKTFPWSEIDFLKIFAKKNKVDRCFIQDNKGNYFSVASTGTRTPFKAVTVSQGSDKKHCKSDLIVRLIETKKCVTGFVFNTEYEEVQSTKFSSNLEGINIQKEILETIKATPSKDDGFGGKEYDIRFNPGRSLLISNSWLIVGWRMWFNKDFYHLVSRQKILDFPHAVENVLLNNGIVYVQLFEKLEEPFTPDAMFRQWKWREWMEYDELDEHFG
ncbi:hypothetical protein LZZ85_26315 [Terrimonas sp. NA20]|uniref:Uncharacterized protein n=1 Tax=Terrimonas ginsenosidimutans TaxID=2908004 RepID=A0ABS9KZU7_9BACT|nr:hypothetical protein [Terrimonas ginsenosidimutans]MCG2617843.1 hypothetical protein [Terrimonas ginsenosidimutans]